MDPAAATDLAAGNATRRLLVPACVFVIVYGVAKLAELAEWPHLHRDLVAMLGMSTGTVTGLLAAGKGAELVLTVLAVLALIRRSEPLLLSVVAGWAADLALLTTVTAIGGDRGRMLEHGLTFVAFAVLLTVMYANGETRAADVVSAVLRRRTDANPAEHGRRAVPARETGRTPAPEPEPDETLRGLPDETRRDLQVRAPGSDTTRLDLPARVPDVTRHDLHVRRPRAPEPPRT